MIKKQFLILAIISLMLAMGSCKKSDTNTCVSNNTGVPTAAEVASLQSYLTANNITATQHSGGFFYKITTQGAGATPNLSSKVTVKYTGTLTNGSIFDQSSVGVTFTLSSLILGWQKGLPLIQQGGFITLYLPPSLGYGCQQAGSIPPGSNTIFTIDLINVQ